MEADATCSVQFLCKHSDNGDIVGVLALLADRWSRNEREIFTPDRKLLLSPRTDFLFPLKRSQTPDGPLTSVRFLSHNPSLSRCLPHTRTHTPDRNR